MNHLMIDNETMGTGADAVLISIGAIAFNPDTGWVDDHGGIELFPTFQDQLDAKRVVCPDTFMWWLKQSDEARRGVTSARRASVAGCMESLRDYWNRMNCKFVWSHGATFDVPQIESMMEGERIPWRFYNIRDTRTLWHLCPIDKPEATKHTALADAVEQATRTLAAWQKIKLVAGPEIPLL